MPGELPGISSGNKQPLTNVDPPSGFQPPWMDFGENAEVTGLLAQKQRSYLFLLNIYEGMQLCRSVGAVFT